MESYQSAYSSSEYQVLKNYNNHRHYKSKWEHRRRKGDHRSKMHSFEPKNVTKNIYVEKNEFKGNINLDTTVCDYKNSKQESCDQTNLKNFSDIKRIVPHCLRPSCRRNTYQGARFRHTKHCKTGLFHENNWNVPMKCMSTSKRKCRHSRHGEKHREETLGLTKNVPKFSEWSKNELEYEDISTTSMGNYLEIPTSYKYVIKGNEEKHESKLDTLIKRTKERERKLVEESRRTTQWYTSTPALTESSSFEFPISCSEIASLHSQSTLILEPKEHGYSPSFDRYSPSKMEIFHMYSESMATDENIIKYPGFDLDIKVEPAMDIEAYSPINSPDLTKNHKAKNEIKIETKQEFS